MAYPHATADDVAFFAEHGWIVVTDAVDPADLSDLEDRCNTILEKKETLAFDWAGDGHRPRPARLPHPPVEPDDLLPRAQRGPLPLVGHRVRTALLGRQVEFWYDQFLAKPPGVSVATLWHQDEAYWGRNLDERGITCWMPLHDVDERNGCMHFIDRGHRDGILAHRQPPDVQSDLIFCEPDESRTVAAPSRSGASPSTTARHRT